MVKYEKIIDSENVTSSSQRRGNLGYGDHSYRYQRLQRCTSKTGKYRKPSIEFEVFKCSKLGCKVRIRRDFEHIPPIYYMSCLSHDHSNERDEHEETASEENQDEEDNEEPDEYLVQNQMREWVEGVILSKINETHQIFLRDHLDPDQTSAVNVPLDEDVLLESFAGGGKTRTILGRVLAIMKSESSTNSFLDNAKYVLKKAPELKFGCFFDKLDANLSLASLAKTQS